MPLLIVAVVVLLALLAWVLLLPLWLYLRFRQGKARRRLVPWLVRLNAWAALASTALYLLGMGVTSHWWPGAVTHALWGLAAGVCTGGVGVLLGRVEHLPGGSYHTPSPWVSAALVLMVLVRLAAGVVDAWRRIDGQQALAWLPAFDHTSLFALGGLLLGHGMATAWGLRWRMPARANPR